MASSIPRLKDSEHWDGKIEAMNNFIQEAFCLFFTCDEIHSLFGINTSKVVHFYPEVVKTTQASQILASQLWVGEIKLFSYIIFFMYFCLCDSTSVFILLGHWNLRTISLLKKKILAYSVLFLHACIQVYTNVYASKYGCMGLSKVSFKKPQVNVY